MKKRGFGAGKFNGMSKQKQEKKKGT